LRLSALLDVPGALRDSEGAKPQAANPYRTVAPPDLAANNGDMSITTTCPYCNAVVPLSDQQLAVGQRVACPRCGEAVPVPTLNGDHAGPAAATATIAAPSSTSRQRNRLVGVGVVAGMLILAGVVSLLLINTRGKRRLTTLAESEAIGYLPDDTNVIIGFNFTEAARTPEGRDTLDRVAPDLERFAGLKPDQIEAAVIGLRVDNNIIPRMRIVIRSKSEIGLDAVRAKLGARSPKTEKDREYFPFQARLGPLSPEFALWSPAPHTLVAVYPADELSKIPAQPDNNADRFAAPIAELLHSRAERDSFLWLAAHADDWSKTSLPATLPLLGVSPDFLAHAKDIRTVGLAMRKETGATTTRARPARVSEGSAPESHAVALDLTLIARLDADMPSLVDGIMAWTDKNNLATNNAETKDARYTVTMVGTPEQWSQAVNSLTKKK
jgi:hypothetical protein